MSIPKTTDDDHPAPALVARDLGIPAVVGTQVATTVIRTGDHTDVDGDTGLVTIRR